MVNRPLTADPPTRGLDFHRGLRYGWTMRDCFPLGSGPADEPNDSPATPDGCRRACQAYVRAIRRKLGPEPDGAALEVREADRDGTRTYEVVIAFEDTNPLALSYAYHCDTEAPATWAEAGMTAPARPGPGKRAR
jgi:hypothetical protein